MKKNWRDLFTSIRRLYYDYIGHTFQERAHRISTLTMFYNFIFAAIKLIVAIFLGSGFIVMSSFTTLAIGFAKRNYFKNIEKNQSQISVPLTLLGFSVIYITYMILQIIFIHQTIDVGTIPAITVAVVAFSEIGVAIYGLLKSVRLEEKSLTMLKAINLCSALTALVLTQSVLLAMDSGTLNHYIADASFGIGIGVVCATIAVILLVKQRKSINL